MVCPDQPTRCPAGSRMPLSVCPTWAVMSMMSMLRAGIRIEKMALTAGRVAQKHQDLVESLFFVFPPSSTCQVSPPPFGPSPAFPPISRPRNGPPPSLRRQTCKRVIKYCAVALRYRVVSRQHRSTAAARPGFMHKRKRNSHRPVTRYGTSIPKVLFLERPLVPKKS